MATYSLREASLLDAFALAPRLRRADLAEIAASCNAEAPLFVLLRLLEQSTLAFCIQDDSGVVIGLCGLVCARADSVVGHPWMLATPALERAARAFLRHSETVVRLMHRRCPVLYNQIDARNRVHMRWLRWLGFRFVATGHVQQHNGVVFHTFFRIAAPGDLLAHFMRTLACAPSHSPR